MIEDNPVPQFVARHRKLDAQIKALEAERDANKAKLKPIVEAMSPLPGTKATMWKDKEGYIRIVTRSDQVSFSNKEVNDLAVTWAASNDPIMQACGEMLLKKRSTKSGFTYIQIK